jgi:hypothetical protein
MAMATSELSDHTLYSRVQALQIVLANVAGRIIQKIALVSKLVSDGSNGHGQYKQSPFSKESDSALLLHSLIPIQPTEQTRRA